MWQEKLSVRILTSNAKLGSSWEILSGRITQTWCFMALAGMGLGFQRQWTRLGSVGGQASTEVGPYQLAEWFQWLQHNCSERTVNGIVRSLTRHRELPGRRLDQGIISSKSYSILSWIGGIRRRGKE